MTLREIAELAGVSPSAVSRYLNGGSLSAAKYEAIDKVIKETGYVPNQVAHDLRTGRVRQVGILVPKIHSKSVSQVVEGAHEVLAKAGYMTVLGSLEHAPESVGQYLEWMQAYHMAGAIVMAANDADVRNGHRSALQGLQLCLPRRLGCSERPHEPAPEARPHPHRLHFRSED